MGNINKQNPTRFFTLALGKYDNFTHTTEGLIAAGDGTPSVSEYSLLWADSAGPLTISYFDDATEGQVVIVGNIGSSKVDFDGANLVEQNSAPILTGEFASFINHNSSWYELFRSQSNAVGGMLTVVPQDSNWYGTTR